MTKNETLSKAFFEFDFFIKFFLTHHILDKSTGKITPFNQMALDYFKEFNPREKGIRKIIRASRGASKTTLIALADTLHRLLYSTEKFIVIFSSTAPLSMDKIKDIRTELIWNERIQNYFNVQFEQKRISTEQFTITTKFGRSTIKAQSFFSQIRGLKKREERPTRMIFDDVTHGERVFSEVQREKAKRQYETDIVNAGSPSTSYIFVGTTIHKDDLVTELSRSPLWKSYTYPAIERWPDDMNLWKDWEDIMLNREDKDREAKADKFYLSNKEKMDKGAKVLWPERENLLYLMKLRLQGRRSFDAEKQMRPYLSGDSLFPQIGWFKLTWKDGVLGFLIEDNEVFLPMKSVYPDHRWQIFYALDPATGEKKTQSSKRSLSFSSRIIVYRDITTDRKFVLKDRTNRDSPSSVIREMIEWSDQYKFQRIGVEANLFRDLYKSAIEHELDEFQKRKGYRPEMPFYEVYQDESKEQRIYGIEPKIYSKEIIFCRGLSNEAIGQLENYPNTDHNDFLDAVEIMAKITDPNEGYQLITI